MVEHVTIIDQDRHEAKHVSTATAGQVLKCVTPGTSGFSFISYQELTNKPSVGGFVSVLSGSSTATSQDPAGLATPLQVEFGPAQNTTHANLAVNGSLTFNTAGQFVITLSMRFGRAAGTGDAYLFSRLLMNGTQYLNSNGMRLSNQDIVFPYSTTITINAAAGDVLTLQILRDATGSNNGGLIKLTPALAGWNPVPSATITVSKFVGLV